MPPQMVRSLSQIVQDPIFSRLLDDGQAIGTLFCNIHSWRQTQPFNGPTHSRKTILEAFIDMRLDCLVLHDYLLIKTIKTERFLESSAR
jgi:hypothetical protein